MIQFYRERWDKFGFKPYFFKTKGYIELAWGYWLLSYTKKKGEK